MTKETKTDRIPEKYPRAWEVYNDEIDRYFPKGDKRRGEVLAMVPMIFIALDKEVESRLSKQVDAARQKISRDAVTDFIKAAVWGHGEIRDWLLEVYHKQYAVDSQEEPNVQV